MQLVKLLLDLGPLVIFFGVWWLGGHYEGLFDAWLPVELAEQKNAFFPATAAFVVATLISLAATFAIFRKVAVMPLVTAVLVTVFGGLTLYLADETFLKMKPTFVYILFAVVLFAGLALNRPFMKILFEEAFKLTEDGWRKLTWRWAGFFLFLAFLNEFIWRSFSTDLWVKFKVFGFLPLTMIFAIAQISLIQRYSHEVEKD
jgi:intracellular septation protein